MTTNKQTFFELITEKIKTNTLPETDLLNTTVLFFDLLKKASTDRQWLAKRLPHNTPLLDLFVLFAKEELIKKLPHIATLNELDFSSSIPSLITTHHKILRDACEQFLQQQLEPLLSFTFNIENGEFLLLKKLLFYIEHAFNLESNNKQLQLLLNTLQNKLSQDLFFTSVYLLMSDNGGRSMSRIQFDWLASQFLQKEKLPIIEYVIGQWTRQALVSKLIAQGQKMTETKPETSEEEEMMRDIMFIFNQSKSVDEHNH